MRAHSEILHGDVAVAGGCVISKVWGGTRTVEAQLPEAAVCSETTRQRSGPVGPYAVGCPRSSSGRIKGSRQSVDCGGVSSRAQWVDSLMTGTSVIIRAVQLSILTVEVEVLQGAVDLQGF